MPPEEKDQYEERYIEAPSYSGHKVVKIVRSRKWVPTTTVRYGTYGPEEERIEAALARPMPKKEKKIPAKFKTKTKAEGITFTGARRGKIVQINYNGRYDYGFIKKYNSAFKFAFTAEHGKFKRWDNVKFDLKRTGQKDAIATNLVLIK